MNAPGPQPIAVLRIPKIHLEVPVLPGTDDFVLNRAVGHIEDTALPGTDGNSGIAGHRDGFFRGLKDIGTGDAIELETLRGKKEVYRVERIWVVDPEDVSVIDPTPTRSLTLVTCYPFYHVGPAPQRYIVRAVRADTAPVVHGERSIGVTDPARRQIDSWQSALRELKRSRELKCGPSRELGNGRNRRLYDACNDSVGIV